MKKLIVVLLCFVLIVDCLDLEGILTEDHKPYTDTLEQVSSSFKELVAVADKKAFDIELLKDLVGKFAPMFGMVGAAFAIVSALIPKGPSPELQALQQGFKNMHLRFDRLERRLDDVLIAVEKNDVYNHYTKNQQRLWQVMEKHQQYLEVHNSTRAQYELQQACNSPATDPGAVLNKIHKDVTRSGSRFDFELLPTILKATDYDIAKVTAIAHIIITDATQASVMRHMCLGLVTNNLTHTVTRLVDDTKLKLQEITQAFSDLVHQLKRDFRISMEPIVRRMAKERGKEAPDAENIQKTLQEKFSWLQFGVLIWKSREERFAVNSDYLYVNGTNVFHFVDYSHYTVTINWVSLEEGGDQWKKLSRTSNICGPVKKYATSPFPILQDQVREALLQSPTSMIVVLKTGIFAPRIINYAKETSTRIECYPYNLWIGY